MDGQFPTFGSLAQIIHATSLASFGALAAQVWEYLICLDKEVDYIWGGRFSTKVLYFVIRYFPFIAQTIHIVILSIFDGASRVCNSELALRVGFCQVILTCVEIIQLARVHASFNRSRTTGRILLGIFVTSSTLEWTGSGLAIQNIVMSSITGPPVRFHTPDILAFIGSGLCQLTILGLTVVKFVMVRRGYGRTPLAWAIAKEFSVIVLLLAVISAMITYEIVQSFGLVFWNAAYSWYLSLMSIIGCRLLLGIRKVTLLTFRGNEEVTGDVNLDEMQYSTSLSTER